MTEFAAETDSHDPHVLKVSGELDLASVETFLDHARAALASATPVLALDLGGLEFVDSTGLGALVRLHKEARGAGKAMELTRVPSHVSRILEVSGLSELFADRSGR